MIKTILTIFVTALCLSCTSVTVIKTTPGGNVPPGQMKKATGAKSAKEYAPGQQKKKAGAKSAREFAPGQQKKK